MKERQQKMSIKFESDGIRLWQGDCLELMKDIPDGCVDAVICDLPYGILLGNNSHTKWDNTIPYDKLWTAYRRVVKPNGMIALFGQGMFTARTIVSNPDMWRYNLVWNKCRTTGFLNAKIMPLKCHEDIMVFYAKLPTYNPQMEDLNGREPNHLINSLEMKTNRIYRDGLIHKQPTFIDKKFPRSIISIPREHNTADSKYHPTQKPVALLEYLIRTYTNEGDTVLDNCMGSGSTGVACVNTGRRFIGIEKEERYYNTAVKRVKDELAQQTFF